MRYEMTFKIKSPGAVQDCRAGMKSASPNCRMKASADQDGGTHFSGSGRMMVPLGGLEVMNAPCQHRPPART